LEERGIVVRKLPNAGQATVFALDAATRYRHGRRRLNMADCFHYACARHFGVPILSTADELRFTDLEVVP
jgi:ribonuclease VapC